MVTPITRFLNKIYVYYYEVKATNLLFAALNIGLVGQSTRMSEESAKLNVVDNERLVNIDLHSAIVFDGARRFFPKSIKSSSALAGPQFPSEGTAAI